MRSNFIILFLTNDIYNRLKNTGKLNLEMMIHRRSVIKIVIILFIISAIHQFSFNFLRQLLNKKKNYKQPIPINKNIKERFVDLAIDNHLIINSNHQLNSSNSPLPIIFVGGFARSGANLMVFFEFSIISFSIVLKNFQFI